MDRSRRCRPRTANFVAPHSGRVPGAIADLVAFVGRLDIPVLVGSTAVPISAGLLVDIERYFASLDSFRDGDAGPIVREFAMASGIAAATGTTLVDDLVAQLEDSRAKMKGIRSDAAAGRILPALVGQPAVNTRYLMNVLGFGEMAALRAFEALTDRGGLTETTGRTRGRVWQHKGIFEVLDDYAAGIRRMSVR